MLNVSEKAITYTNEFKIHFIAEYTKGKISRIIFEEASFDVEIIGINVSTVLVDRWRKAFNEHGVLGLMIQEEIIVGVHVSVNLLRKK